MLTSYRQVQDLQNQLQETRQQLDKMRKLLSKSMVSQEGTPESTVSGRNRLDHSHEPSPSPIPNFGDVRRDVQKYSRGVFKVPPERRPHAPTPLLNTEEVMLPPRKIVDVLLNQYHDHIYAYLPLIDWKQFIDRVEQAYSKDSFVGFPQIWVSCFFAVLACGTLPQISSEDGVGPDSSGMKYIVVASRLLNTWTDNIMPDHARVTLMMSIFLTEQNIRSAGWIYLGSALRMCQDSGLHLEKGPWSRQEGEARRRTYWCAMAWERYAKVRLALNCR
jgi:hypothetical protein